MNRIISTLIFLYPAVGLSMHPPGGQNPEPLILSKFCFIKKELQADTKVSFDTKKGKKSVLSLTNDKATPIKIFSHNSEVKFPETLKPNHLPLTLYTKGKIYVLGSNGYTLLTYPEYFNPLADRMGGTVMLGATGQIKLSYPQRTISEKEYNSYFEAPFHYYLGDKLVLNKIKVYFSKAERYNSKGWNISRIEFQLPLPKGMEIKSEDRLIESDLFSLYSALKLSYKGKDNILFVKEFESSLDDSVLIKQGYYPIYIYEKGECFSLNKEPEYSISREKFGEYYDKAFKNELDVYERDKEISEEDRNAAINSLKSKTLYFDQPINGFIFPGDAKEKKKCSLDYYNIASQFLEKKTTENKMQNPTFVKLPEDEKVQLISTINSQQVPLQLIKHYFINKNWKPIDALRSGRSGCAPYCPEVLNKEENNYIKNIKVEYPQTNFKEEELVCGFTGNDNNEYAPDNENADFDWPGVEY